MTESEILQMARKAWGKAGILAPYDEWFTARSNAFAWFAVLVAEVEQEACAKVCEAQYIPNGSPEDIASTTCANAIRAKGKVSGWDGLVVGHTRIKGWTALESWE
jgi:hypothetical protein